jgi:hypothetical protein
MTPPFQTASSARVSFVSIRLALPGCVAGGGIVVPVIGRSERVRTSVCAATEPVTVQSVAVAPPDSGSDVM